jgi:hypothetical protein
MISASCNFNEFIQAVKDNEYFDILYKADREATDAERRSYRTQVTSENRDLCGKQYASLLKNFMFYMRYGIKLRAISDDQFQLFRSVRQNLQ